MSQRVKASALVNAMRKAERFEREKWQEVVAEKDAALSEKDAEIALLRAMLNGK